eukprot:5820974-Lingulodinium_polyedra.AAC.1
MEPWVLSSTYREHADQAGELARAFFWYRGFLRAITILRQHVPLPELANLVRAAFYAPPEKFFPKSAAGAR